MQKWRKMNDNEKLLGIFDKKNYKLASNKKENIILKKVKLIRA